MAIIRIDCQVLSQILFGNDEVHIKRAFNNFPFIDFEVLANPDLGLGDGAAVSFIEIRTDIRVIDRKYRRQV